MNKIQKLDRIYARLPKIKCKGKCYTSCGIIPMTKIEKDRIIEKVGFTGIDPFPPLSQYIDDFNAHMDVTCKMLDPVTKKCTIYAIRPYICRLYGLTKGLPCRYGCIPERWLSQKEAFLIRWEIEKLKGNSMEKIFTEKA